MKLIILLGPPGSGKGTWSNLLIKDKDFRVLSSSELFKKIDNTTELGKSINKLIIQGELIPDDMTNQLVDKAIKSYKNIKYLILDGYPRTINQINYLEKKYKVKHALYIECELEEIVKRLSKRLICPKCQASYSINNFSSKIPHRCDNDGEKLIRRKDDKPEIIKHRYKIYTEKTAPLIAYFKEKNTLFNIEISVKEDNAIDYIKNLVQ